MWRCVGLACSMVLVASAVLAQGGQWHELTVPGGRATLQALGVDASRERAVTMIEIIRRLHFSTTPLPELEQAIKRIPITSTSTLTLPMPIAHAVWEKEILRRSVEPSRLFSAILGDPPARLLFHGLAALDGETRAWMASERGLLSSLYDNLDAAKAFAMFAPTIRISAGRVDVPGGQAGAARWGEVLGAPNTDPRRFVSRLFLERAGRAAGLYALIASVDARRQRFLLGAADRFERLVSSFAGCYPRQSNDYPFVMRGKDPALLLLYLPLASDGAPAGPRDRGFWDAVFSSNELGSAESLMTRDDIDAAWLVDRLCSSSIVDRAQVFTTFLTGHRTFANLPGDQRSDAVVALRVRRLFPALFMAMERAGVTWAETFVTAGRAARRVDRLDGMIEAPVALQQLQGAMAMALGAFASGSIDESLLNRLLSRLAGVQVIDERYDGRLAEWLERDLLPTLGRGERVQRKGSTSVLPLSVLPLSAEDTVASALAGPAPPSATRVHWEGLDYVLDFPAFARARLKAVRAKQGGDTLDAALDRFRTARDARAIVAADAALGRVLASWAYAPHVGGADSGALIGGDPSMRHDLGIRLVNRTRYEQRWELAVAPAERGAIAGSYFGLEASLAGFSLRRLSADRIPAEPTIGDNDRSALFVTVTLADPRGLVDADMQRMAKAVADGSTLVDAAMADAHQLSELATRAAISPWRREVLGWMMTEEPDRIREQFPPAARARLAGVTEPAAGWGTSAIPRGCLCVLPPPAVYPEAIAGRPADGIVGAHSADLMFRVAELLTELKVPAPLAPSVLAYAMRDYIDGVRPAHPADVDAFARQAPALTRSMVEDYIGAIAAIGPLLPVSR